MRIPFVLTDGSTFCVSLVHEIGTGNVKIRHRITQCGLNQGENKAFVPEPC